MLARVVAPNELTSSDLARWSECAACSLEPNPFFEPGWLLPALEYLNESPTTMLVLAEHKGAVQACVPIVEITADQSRTGGQGRHSALETRVAPTAVTLGTPLVTAEGGCEALACVMTEIGREAERRGASLVIMEWVGYGGPTARLLRELAVETKHLLVEFDVWERGFLRRQAGDGECYWLRGIGKNRRRTIRQHYLHLNAALGTSPSLRMRTDGAAVDSFLRLEASGWKGHQPGGLAFRREAATTKFFEAVCGRYIDDGRMWFLSLEGGGAPIAMICCVRAGEGVFAYRTAYDEDLARFGPGVEVFLAAMEHFDRETDALWFDTCSARDNQHLLGLFPDRRAMATVMFRVPGSQKPAEPVDRGIPEAAFAHTSGQG
jgi:CelD/BcsL family acetyltransferase involved in cellulose biosynthesis